MKGRPPMIVCWMTVLIGCGIIPPPAVAVDWARQ